MQTSALNAMPVKIVVLKALLKKDERSEITNSRFTVRNGQTGALSFREGVPVGISHFNYNSLSSTFNPSWSS